LEASPVTEVSKDDPPRAVGTQVSGNKNVGDVVVPRAELDALTDSSPYLSSAQAWHRRSTVSLVKVAENVPRRQRLHARGSTFLINEFQ
jgi:hypothetical protein